MANSYSVKRGMSTGFYVRYALACRRDAESSNRIVTSFPYRDDKLKRIEHYFLGALAGFLLELAWTIHGFLHYRIAIIRNRRRTRYRHIKLILNVDINL